MTESLVVGWCHSSIEASAIFEPPARLALDKDQSKAGRSHLSCPAVRSLTESYYFIRSPFSLRLRFRKVGSDYHFVPVYPFTTLSENLFRELLTVEPRDTWRSERFPIIQIPSPYLFICDIPAFLEQHSPFLVNSSGLNWRLIPGKYDIYAWQRPLNWAIEWDIEAGDLIVRTGEPLYFLRFCDPDGNVFLAPRFVETEFTDELRERVGMARGVTGFRKGLNSVMIKAAGSRHAPLITPKAN